MRFNHIVAGLAGAAALFGTAIACAADNPEHDATWERQAYDPSHAAMTDRREATPATMSRASTPPRPFIHGFHKLTPEEETWDPAIDMDPRIGRYQDPNAPN